MIGRNVAIYVSAAPIDMRRSFDGLAAAARETLKQDPESGALFVFANKRGEGSTFYIQIAQGSNRLSLASPLW